MPAQEFGILGLLMETRDGVRSLGIGDPTPLGWLTVAAYFGAAWLCLRAARAARPVGEEDRRPARAWMLLGLLMLALGVNKQLDLQLLLTAIGKDVARRGGWYDERRTTQLWFIRGVVATGLATLIVGAFWLRRHAREFALPGVGALFTVAFVLVRASSFHHVDSLFSNGPGEVRMNWVLELGGIACIALGARARLRRTGSSPPLPVPSQ